MSWVQRRWYAVSALPDAQKFTAHDHAGDRVECAKGLVEKENVGIDRQSAGDLQALLHASGKVGRISLLEALEPHQLHIVGDAVSRSSRESLERPKPMLPSTVSQGKTPRS